MENFSKTPEHVAIIMDGNGRWAKEKALPRIEGHRRGVDSIREVVRTARELGVKYLTLYAFSKENWARSGTEVNFLMTLLGHYLDSELHELEENQIRFNVIGNLSDLPSEIQTKIRRNIQKTTHYEKMTLTLALSYSSRLEIVEAVKKLCARVKANTLSLDDISEDTFSLALDTAGIPDPDLLIRTSGEYRISNFLLWQISYTELYVSEKNWPDFRKPDFLHALQAFSKRERRFGRAEPQNVNV